jgi:hypothetical protein
MMRNIFFIFSFLFFSSWRRSRILPTLEIRFIFEFLIFMLENLRRGRILKEEQCSEMRKKE